MDMIAQFESSSDMFYTCDEQIAEILTKAKRDAGVAIDCDMAKMGLLADGCLGVFKDGVCNRYFVYQILCGFDGRMQPYIHGTSASRDAAATLLKELSRTQIFVKVQVDYERNAIQNFGPGIRLG